ncbi:tyrosine-type recombinase/integrase [Lysinibacillus sphaericus]|uniref:site-specific integrase n=1 Tax=Lysinibacillus sphaericus TaxID=1421 RepID=UPI00069104E1|nr:tyrosine-type recombinase/integrase [Lysinibacillus sphaericus]
MTKTNPIKEYTLKNGEKRYMFKIYGRIDPLTGKPRHITRRGFKSKREAKATLNKIKAEVSNGTYKKKIAETYKDIYDLWVIPYESSVQDSTFLKTIGIFKNHILPVMGTYRIEKIDIAACQNALLIWTSKLKGFKKVKAYASVVLEFAVNHGYLTTNPFDKVVMPTNKTSEEKENFYNANQLTKILECFKREGNLKVYAFFHLLAYSGLRKGEAFALTWQDINFETGYIKINKAITRGKNGLYIGTVKNGTPRIIKLDDKTLDLLLQWQSKLSEEKVILTGKKLTKKDFIFPSSDLSKLPEPNQTHRWLTKVITKYNLEPITAHGFRHTHCSLLFEANAGIKEVQYRLGHKDVKTTLQVYTHVTQKTKACTVDKFVTFLKNNDQDNDQGLLEIQ